MCLLTHRSALHVNYPDMLPLLLDKNSLLSLSIFSLAITKDV